MKIAAPNENDMVAGEFGEPSPAQAVMTRAFVALGLALCRSKPGTILTPAGYVKSAAENLLDGVSLQDFEADLRQGDGNELEGKFLAAHSSSALAVNNFAPFKRHPEMLNLVGLSGLSILQFECKCPTGLPGKPPNLDLVAESKNGVVGVESKCTEFLRRHIAKFRPVYAERLSGASRPWFAEMMRLKKEPASYVWLDAALLIKHAFGLARTFDGQRTILLYLFWEPTNASSFPVFDEHRQEIEDFSCRVANGSPEFRAMSYRELWSEWESSYLPDWLREHLQRVRDRYEIAI